MLLSKYQDGYQKEGSITPFLQLGIAALTGDINALVFEIPPSGSCKYNGHSFADGMYLMIIEQKVQMSIRTNLIDEKMN